MTYSLSASPAEAESEGGESVVAQPTLSNSLSMLSKEEIKRLSKLLSYTLRHHPEHLDLTPDTEGWVDVDTLIAQLQARGEKVNGEVLRFIVDTNDKQRFRFSDDFTRIRASQGHSIEVSLNYIPATPPHVLYHGTAEKNLMAIRENGLLKMSRQHVHLSADKKTAIAVGQRHGKAVVLEINTGLLSKQGHLFFLSDNNVWLTDRVPAGFIVFPPVNKSE